MSSDCSSTCSNDVSGQRVENAGGEAHSGAAASGLTLQEGVDALTNRWANGIFLINSTPPESEQSDDGPDGGPSEDSSFDPVPDDFQWSVSGLEPVSYWNYLAKVSPTASLPQYRWIKWSATLLLGSQKGFWEWMVPIYNVRSCQVVATNLIQSTHACINGMKWLQWL